MPLCLLHHLNLASWFDALVFGFLLLMASSGTHDDLEINEQ